MARTVRTQGMNWIRKEKRLALYLRDGMACAYCAATVEDGAQLTLDHLHPYSQGGDNASENLVTCCLKCNSARGDRAVETFVEAVAGYLNHGITAEAILAHIHECITRPVDVAGAKTLMARRASWADCLNT